MKENIRRHICTKLDDLAKDHGVRIIHAAESGSRAWGFPSRDSDYDVRFIYVRNRDDYLSLDRPRDVIETEIAWDPILNADFDLNGWDISKALSLGLRSNGVVHEWLCSPLCYQCTPQTRHDLLSFINEVCDLRAYFHFYRNYTRESWAVYQRGETGQVKIKHYCYALRCALCLAWLEQHKTPPPMDILTLRAGLDLSPALHHEIDQFVDLKAQATESDHTAGVRILDDFINRAFAPDRPRPPRESQNRHHLDRANALFRQIITAHQHT